MAKLYFYYSAMNAGKTTLLLQSSYNYRERGMNTQLFIPSIDGRAGFGVIGSRIGLTAEATAINAADDMFQITRNRNQDEKVHCVLVDEVQFFDRQHIEQLTEIVDKLNIPVLAYGIRTDFRGELFSGSQYLLAWADVLQEIKSICLCGHKATMVLRLDANGGVLTKGAQCEIGGNDRYVSVCRLHYKQALSSGSVPEISINSNSAPVAAT